MVSLESNARASGGIKLILFRAMAMKWIFGILMFSVILIACSFDIKNTSINSEQDKNSINVIISEIRKEYININSDTNLIVIEKDLTGISTEGGTQFNYYDKTELRKSFLNFYGEMGKKVEEYYFKDGRLFFLFKQEFYYNQPIYVQEGFEVEKIEENRYYFDNDNLVRWIDNYKTLRDVSNEDSKKLASELIAKAKAIIDY